MGDLGPTPGSGRCPGGGHGNPLQESCLENPHGQRSLAGYSPRGRKESDVTERIGTALGFPGGASVKESTCQYRRRKRCGFDPWVGKIPGSRERQPIPVFMPGESHGQRKLVGYSP